MLIWLTVLFIRRLRELIYLTVQPVLVEREHLHSIRLLTLKLALGTVAL
jgi:hypothetical protein